jgi:hypothetical protein
MPVSVIRMMSLLPPILPPLISSLYRPLYRLSRKSQPLLPPPCLPSCCPPAALLLPSCRPHAAPPVTHLPPSCRPSSRHSCRPSCRPSCHPSCRPRAVPPATPPAASTAAPPAATPVAPAALSVALLPRSLRPPVPALKRNFDLCIPRKGIAPHQSKFSHSCVCERSIYSHDRSTYFPAAEKAYRSIVGIYKSLTVTSMYVGICRAIGL